MVQDTEFTSVRLEASLSFSCVAVIKALSRTIFRSPTLTGRIIGGDMGKSSVKYQEHLIESLKDPDQALEYLKAALEESDMPEVFLLALRNVAQARGIRQLAEETDLNRESLYRALSGKGNPELSSLWKILNALGLKLSVEPMT
jgi:probable addiction module antidote protein